MAKKTGDLNGARRRMLMNMLWSLLSLFINYFMNFLITPYVTNNIGVEAYGFVALANTFVSYVDILAVGLNACLLYTSHTKKPSTIRLQKPPVSFMAVHSIPAS